MQLARPLIRESAPPNEVLQPTGLATLRVCLVASEATSIGAQARPAAGRQLSPDPLGGVIVRMPKEVVQAWVDAFNRADVEALAALYAEDAINHQVMWEPLRGRAAIRAMLQNELGRAEMTCVVENLFEDGDWAILEWRDPKGLRGCGFFNVVDGHIRLQRGYWDQLSFLRQQGLPIPEES